VPLQTVNPDKSVLAGQLHRRTLGDTIFVAADSGGDLAVCVAGAVHSGLEGLFVLSASVVGAREGRYDALRGGHGETEGVCQIGLIGLIRPRLDLCLAVDVTTKASQPPATCLSPPCPPSKDTASSSQISFCPSPSPTTTATAQKQSVHHLPRLSQASLS
jgi:hypothetical protein